MAPPKKLYSRALIDTFAFEHAPSGSQWGAAQLRWLGVELYEECTVESLVPWLPPAKGKIVTSLHSKLGKPWDNIMTDGSSQQDGQEFYHSLYKLVYSSPERPPVIKSAPPTASPKRLRTFLDFSMHQALPLRSAPTLETNSNDAESAASDPSPPSSPTRHARTSRTTGLSGRTIDSMLNEESEAVLASSIQMRTNTLNPALRIPQRSPRNSDGTPHRLQEPGLRALHRSPQSSSSDSDFVLSDCPSSSPDVVRDSNGPIEDSVAEAVRGFVKAMNVSLNALNMDDKLRWDYSVQVPLQIVIDGATMKTTPDVRWEMNDLKEQVLVRGTTTFEVKRLSHGCNFEDILGQEVAHMLCEAFALKDDRKGKIFTTYCISWHHLDAYISPLEVSRDYLRQLQGPEPYTEHIRVHRSSRYDLKQPNERLELARAAVGIMVASLQRYQRAAALIKRIHDYP